MGFGKQRASVVKAEKENPLNMQVTVEYTDYTFSPRARRLMNNYHATFSHRAGAMCADVFSIPMKRFLGHIASEGGFAESVEGCRAVYYKANGCLPGRDYPKDRKGAK